MDRTQFLQMAQRVSMLKSGICGIKENVPDDLKVVHNDVVYYPVAYELSFENGKPTHTAILHDLRANAIIKVKLERVKKNEK